MKRLIENYLENLSSLEIEKVYRMIGDEISEWIEKGYNKLDSDMCELLDTCLEIILEEREEINNQEINNQEINNQEINNQEINNQEINNQNNNKTKLEIYSETFSDYEESLFADDEE
jgi:hypothetical protein